MTDINEYVEGSMFNAEGVTKEGSVFTIKGPTRHEALGTVEFDDGKETALYFEETKQGVTLNATRRKAVIAMYGRDVDEWPGKKVMLRRGKTKYMGKPIDCIDIVEPTAGAVAPF